MLCLAHGVTVHDLVPVACMWCASAALRVHSVAVRRSASAASVHGQGLRPQAHENCFTSADMLALARVVANCGRPRANRSHTLPCCVPGRMRASRVLKAAQHSYLSERTMQECRIAV